MRLYKKKLFAGLVLAAMFVSSAYSAGNLQPEEAARSEHTAETTMETSEIATTEESRAITMNVQIGSSTFTATLEDNTAVDSFVRMMQTAPVVIQMNDYSGFEKVGSIGTSLPASNSQTTTQSGDIVLYNGTTQTTERVVNPDSEYLKAVPEHLRSYEEAVSYWPNQTYIGNAHPDELAAVEFPYYDKKKEGAKRYGKYGEIMPEEEFLLLVQACDMFEVVRLDKAFVAKYKDVFAQDPIISDDIIEKIHEGVELSEIEALINEDHAEPLYFEHQLVGCVKPAHDIDVNLSSHIMHENLMSKASSVLALLYAVKNAGIEKSDVEYVIDCAEEACGDMNQRGGGNFAKAAAEVACKAAIAAIDRAYVKGIFHKNAAARKKSTIQRLYNAM